MSQHEDTRPRIQLLAPFSDIYEEHGVGKRSFTIQAGEIGRSEHPSPEARAVRAEFPGYGMVVVPIGLFQVIE